METGHEPSPFSAGLGSRCPRCGEGRLYAGYLTLADQCDVCDLDLAQLESGDGPAFFIILIVGFILGAAILYTELTYTPPYWVHAVIALVLGVLLPLVLLRPAKAYMIALQYKNKAAEGRLD